MAYYRADYDEQYSVGKPAAIFLAWLLLNGMPGEIHNDMNGQFLRPLRTRAIDPRKFLQDQCDEKFTDEDVNDEGAAFTGYYFLGGSQNSRFDEDLSDAFKDCLSAQADPATVWSEYDVLAPIIGERYRQWKSAKPRIKPKAVQREPPLHWIFTVLFLASVALAIWRRHYPDCWTMVASSIGGFVLAGFFWIGHLPVRRR